MSHYSDMGFVVNSEQDLDKILNPILQGKVAGTKTYDLGHNKVLRIAKVGQVYFAFKIDTKRHIEEKIGFCYSNENLSQGFNAVKINQKDSNSSDFDILRVEDKDGIPFWFSCLNIDLLDFSKPLASVQFEIASFADAVKVGDKPAFEKMAPESYIAEFNDDPSFAIFNGVVKAFKVETNKSSGIKYYVIDADCMGMHFRLLVDYNEIKESDLAIGKIISGHFWNTAIVKLKEMSENVKNQNINKKENKKMGYNLKNLTEELKAKGLADDGVVAWGQNSSGALFGAIGAGLAGMHTISRKGDKIVVIPFSSKEIKYSEGIMIDKSKIKSAKVSGLMTGKLKLETTDGKKREYSITQGKDAVKEILSKLGF